MPAAFWQGLWTGLITHPLFAVALTLVAFQISLVVYRRTRWLLLQPVMVSTALVVAVLLASGIDYARFRAEAAPIALLLGPATVALAVPLYRNLGRIRQLFWPILVTLVVGGSLTVILTLLIAHLLGAELPVLVSMAPKSATMPIAMLVAEQWGGTASLAAVMVMITGVAGTAMGPWLYRLAGVHSPAARGLGYGINAHAVGTVRALEEGDECGAFAALGMSLMGILIAVVLPLGLALWLR
ncbi:LrgB family protein [Stutzerimonas azotifigens]|uniref:LrgB family protein n=1 Tax=Stutzerimonas azotifigens TaxID=291995 RepID=UPI000424C872|nr:LrgB family protein [Stutzerimonas azotifigens]